MAIMKMLMMLVVAATVLFCSHHQVIAANKVAAIEVEPQGSPFDVLCQYWPWPYPWPKPCPPPRPRPRPRPRPCAPPPPPPCSPPPKSPPPPPPRSTPPAPPTTCSASDQQKIKTCMFNTTSIDACCPTFRSILGTSCPCYKYADDLDNQVLITIDAYCDVTSPCKDVQVIKLSKDE